MRSRVSIVSAGACAALLAACGGIPSSGGPMPAAPASDDDPPRHVRGIRPGPEPGAAPVEIVDGFIAAMEFYEPPSGYPTAAEFLTEEAAADWAPLSEIVIYRGQPTVEVDEGVATVAVGIEATYDRTDGFVRYPASADPVSFSFDLERVDGEWRLADAPDRLLIQANAFANDFGEYNLYYFNASLDSTTLVPDPVFLPRTASNLETLLVQELLAGPSGWLAPAVQTEFPAGTSLEPAAVPVNDGDARVTLNGAALVDVDGTSTGPDQRDLMVEQLVRTLGEQRDVDRVSVSVTSEGTPTRLSGTDEDPYVDVADPPAPARADRLYTVTGSGVGWLDEGSAQSEIVPVTGPLGDTPGLHEVAIDRNRRTAAAVDENDELLLAEVNTGGEATQLASAGGAFGSLAWDGSGLLWAIEREREPADPDGETGESGEGDDGESGENGAGDDGAAGDGETGDDASADKKAEGDSGNRVLVIDPETGDVEPVTPPTPGDIEQLAIAPDGARIAFVIDGRIYEAIVVRDPDRPVDLKAIEVTGLRELHIRGLSDPVGDVAWYGPSELALLTAPEVPDDESVEPGSIDASQAAEPRVHVVAISELEVSVSDAREVPSGVSIAATRVGDWLAVGTSDDVVLTRSSTGRWFSLEDATAPAYAG